MSPKILLLFDIDGTLLLTGGCGKVALEKAFEESFGIPHCWGDTVPHGRTDPAILNAICLRVLGRRLTSAEYSRLCERYHGLLRHEIAATTQYRLMPGVPELLTFLSNRKEVFLALGTGNFEDASRIKLERGDLLRYFKCGGFGSDDEDRAEILRHAVRRSEKMSGHPFHKDRVFVIGDTVHDVRAGRSSGFKTIVVLTNHACKEDFRDCPPDHVLKDLSHIPTFMACLDGLYPSQCIPF
ncbi:MAG: HAD hydrolase-like protein [Candidatus Omnitrophica bacterium]|nr:HAD hydrolase-like protein [Candidatus Omnitrophota bacterium]